MSSMLSLIEGKPSALQADGFFSFSNPQDSAFYGFSCEILVKRKDECLFRW